jgi:catechol 2,3-dioxygenase-like lactoylglutathione lyase family enzyme
MMTPSHCHSKRAIRLRTPLSRGLRAFGLALLVNVSSAASPETMPPPPQPMIGIDHISLAVRDLEGAADTYRDLGFALKPGRFHEDGIRNEHVKFEDGNGIELITAEEDRDSPTRTYLKLLSAGEGPAFLNFHTTNLAALENRLATAGYPYLRDGNTVTLSNPNLNYLFFFEGDNRSPTDHPEYFAHPNTARATIGVWIAGGDGSRLVKTLKSLGARIAKKTVFAPYKMVATVAAVNNGEIIFLPASRQVIPGRPIVGAPHLARQWIAALAARYRQHHELFAVAMLARVRAILRNAQIQERPAPAF